ncbi:MAG: NUDIX hydrolase [Oleibacter sp.]|nr:NUDIX hydrolase [Thalassolituus sp.]|tara:strand:- start:2146 stop:2691 length:546 start_codon:yes stop_codon:yes gene_type:complete
MKYCSQCASELVITIPDGDNRERHVCPACQTIFYQNPRIVAGTIPVYQGKVLLCRRAIEPRRGLWTLPAGFMENGESTEEAALRETLEEAQASVDIRSLFSVITVPHIDQVHIFFLAEMRTPEFGAGEESLDVQLFSPEDIPWDEMAFPTVNKTLNLWLKDDSPTQPTHVFDIRTPYKKPE